ncbi:MAG TPA: hypothetical protein VGR43_08555 [Dehalococcoidia bacterium]|jgi:hypothetical protein|nr:hypothetical protein [Dehalococcoidia bacterium]
MKRRISAFMAGQICEAFYNSWSVEQIGARFRISVARVESVIRRWQLRAKRRR